MPINWRRDMQERKSSRASRRVAEKVGNPSTAKLRQVIHDEIRRLGAFVTWFSGCVTLGEVEF